MKHNLPIKIELPEHFLDEEVRCGYIVTTQMKKVWAVEIDLLFEFKRICEKYHLHWYAGGGTMLGAVRHKGYIPWDDDIDIDMLRDDYDKFCQVAPKEIKSPYFYSDGTAEKGVFRAYSRIYNLSTTCIMANSVNVKRSFNQGISIDIFPIDNAPDNKCEMQHFANCVATKFNQCNWLYAHVGCYIPKKNEGIYRKITHFIAYIIATLKWPFFHKKLPQFVYKEMQIYNQFHTTKVVSIALVPFHFGRWWQRSWVEQTIQMPFEWFSINVPCGYEKWLTTHYGNWQEFVVGTGLHVTGIIDAEKSYTEYTK